MALPEPSEMVRYRIRLILEHMRRDVIGKHEFATDISTGSRIEHVIRRGARAEGGTGDAVRIDHEQRAFTPPPCLLWDDGLMHVVSTVYGLAMMGFCDTSRALGQLPWNCRSSQVFAG